MAGVRITSHTYRSSIPLGNRQIGRVKLMQLIHLAINLHQRGGIVLRDRLPAKHVQGFGANR